MALVYTKTTEEYKIGIWQISEDYHALLVAYQPSEDELAVLSNFINERRKLEWICIRLLLREITGYKGPISYNEHGKPYLQDSPYRISISHSGNKVALICSTSHDVGIDIEQLSFKILKVKHKFLTHEEHKALVQGTDHAYHAYLHWSAKEALYKIYGQKNLDFKGHLFIEPFNPLSEGKFQGYIQTENFRQDYELNYYKYENFCLVWICK